jgi:hypothetical protein
MGWNQKYWDLIDQLYWTPGYMGLQSINRREWRLEGDRISVPASLVNRSGPLYSRGLRIDALVGDLHRMEEPLNQIFNLTFALAPDALIQRMFVQSLGFSDSGPFESIGRETHVRYGWNPNENITQHDALFVSATSAIAVELKLGSSTWPGQVMKYAALLAWEEMVCGPKSNLGLLFVAPERARSSHWKKCGLSSSAIDRSFMDQSWAKPLPAPIRGLMLDHRERVASVLDRLQLGFMSWPEAAARMSAFSNEISSESPGDQTLRKLIAGFLDQLIRHEMTGYDKASAL